MDLSREVSDGLDLLGDKNKVCSACFDRILDLGANVASDGNDEGTLQCESCNSAVLKQSHGAFATLVVESSRHDVGSTTAQSLLEEKKWNNQRIQKLGTLLNNRKAEVQAALSQIGRSPSSIVNVDWRLDYCLKTSSMDHVNSLFYLIDLHVVEQKKLRKIQFACTLEELQDLVGKLKEALKSVERVAQA